MTAAAGRVVVGVVDQITDLCNRVLACAPNGHAQGPFQGPSAYGIEQDLDNALAAMQRGETIAAEQAHMTDELWSELKAGIERLGEKGYTSHVLRPYLSRRPEQGECVTAASELYLQLSKYVAAGGS